MNKPNERALIPLTDKQLEVLEPMFLAVKLLNEQGIPCAIGAQVFFDGISVKLFSGEQAEALAAAMGGNVEHKCASATQHFQDGMRRDAPASPVIDEAQALATVDSPNSNMNSSSPMTRYLHGGCTAYRGECRLCDSPAEWRKEGMQHTGIPMSPLT